VAGAFVAAASRPGPWRVADGGLPCSKQTRPGRQGCCRMPLAAVLLQHTHTLFGPLPGRLTTVRARTSSRRPLPVSVPPFLRTRSFLVPSSSLLCAAPDLYLIPPHARYSPRRDDNQGNPAPAPSPAFAHRSSLTPLPRDCPSRTRLEQRRASRTSHIASRHPPDPFARARCTPSSTAALR
jgi:hypothetical protein